MVKFALIGLKINLEPFLHLNVTGNYYGGVYVLQPSDFRCHM